MMPSPGMDLDRLHDGASCLLCDCKFVRKSQYEPSTHRRADLANVAAQPTMCRIGIQPRMPEQGNRDFWRGDGKGKTMHSGAKVSGVSFRNTGDQVGAASESQRG